MEIGVRAGQFCFVVATQGLQETPALLPAAGETWGPGAMD